MMNKLTWMACTAATAIFVAAAPANAIVIEDDDLTDGTSTTGVLPNGATVNGYSDFAGNTPGNFESKTIGSVTGTGIAGGTNGEVDDQEAIEFIFGAPEDMSALSVAFLYPDGEFGDDGDETVDIVITNSGGGQSTVSLTATSPTSATLTNGGGSSVTNGEIAQDGVGEPGGEGGALWEISFGSDAIFDDVTSFTLVAGNVAGNETRFSDFAFVAYGGEPSQQDVPVPATFALMGAGLLGLGLVSRFRKRD